jgi:hypothetical protein
MCGARTRTCVACGFSTRLFEVRAFEFGLDLIVDGLKKIRDTG